MASIRKYCTLAKNTLSFSRTGYCAVSSSASGCIPIPVKKTKGFENQTIRKQASAAILVFFHSATSWLIKKKKKICCIPKCERKGCDWSNHYPYSYYVYSIVGAPKVMVFVCVCLLRAPV